MAYYNSELTGEQIENALNAVNGLVSATNNGKILTVENGKLAAKSAIEIQGGTIDPLSITGNGVYTHSGFGGYSPITVNVPAGSISDCYAIILAYFDSGYTCTCTNGGTTYTATRQDGLFGFGVTEPGIWTISSTNGTTTKTENVTISNRGESKSVYLNTLPLTYQEVEYIYGNSQSKGKNYIDSGIPFSAGSKVEIRASISQTPDYDRLIGLGTIGFIFCYSSTTLAIDNYGETSSLDLTVPHDIVINNNSWKVDNQVVSSFIISSFDITTNIMISTNVTGYYKDRDGRFKIYSCKIFNDIELMRNFIPCYRKSDNEVGLYDIVSRSFFANNGTGTFSAGPDVI